MRKTLLNKIIKYLMIAIGILVNQSAFAENVLYCHTEIATGFKNEGGTWKTTDFVVSRYTLKFNDDYSVVQFPDSIAKVMDCNMTFNKDIIKCHGTSESLTFNKSNLRFVTVFVSTGGYIRPATDTDYLEAGICEKF